MAQRDEQVGMYVFFSPCFTYKFVTNKYLTAMGSFSIVTLDGKRSLLMITSSPACPNGNLFLVVSRRCIMEIRISTTQPPEREARHYYSHLAVIMKRPGCEWTLVFVSVFGRLTLNLVH